MSKRTNELLRQAIADAEAVRETAVANAKLVLEEAITPQIRDMIARRLRVEAAAEKPHEEGRAEGSSQMPADTSKIGDGDNKEPSDDAFDSSDVGNGPENAGDSTDDWYEDWSESDFDLNEVIAELERDIADMSSEQELDHTSNKHPHAHATPSLKMDGVEVDDSDDSDDSDDDDGVDLEEILRELEAFDSMDEGDSEDEDEDMQHSLATEQEADEDDEDALNLDELLAELQAEMDDEEELTEGEEGEEEDEEEDEEVDLGEIIAELRARVAKKKHRAETKHVDSEEKAATKKMATEIASLRTEVAQYRGAINTLRGKLNEVNLLNAKLLFTNKMFRRHGLSNEQKIRIVESFDRATTVREVKLVYSALMENFNVTSNAGATSRKKIVAEGIASKATKSTAPKVIVENTVAKRLQELAGLI
jgi:hypothetical protein